MRRTHAGRYPVKHALFDARSHHIEPTLVGPAALLVLMMLLQTFLVALCLDVLTQVVRLLMLWVMLW